MDNLGPWNMIGVAVLILTCLLLALTSLGIMIGYVAFFARSVLRCMEGK